MKAQTAKPNVDVSALEKGVEDIRKVIDLVTRAKAEAQKMLDNNKQLLDEVPFNIEYQSQVLKLNDYIIKQTQNEMSLYGQIDDIIKAIEANKPKTNQ